jgi:hypothetical protein
LSRYVPRILRASLYRHLFARSACGWLHRKGGCAVDRDAADRPVRRFRHGRDLGR